ncbi:hypothetical protein GCM10025762_49310 [Haloechinothrix salitolerans]
MRPAGEHLVDGASPPVDVLLGKVEHRSRAAQSVEVWPQLARMAVPYEDCLEDPVTALQTEVVYSYLRYGRILDRAVEENQNAHNGQGS